MAGTYGSRASNQFKLPSVESAETYYTIIDSTTGKITLKRINKLVPDSPIPGFSESLDATVGTIESTGPNKGKLITGPGATPTEKKAIAQQPQVTKIVKDQAENTANKSQQQSGVSPEVASARSKELLNTGKATTPPSGDSAAAANAAETQKSLEDLKEGTRYKKGDFNEKLQYPANLQIEQQDVIEFNMLSYEKRSASEGTGQLGSFPERSNYTSRTIGRVILPIPGGISDTNSVSWGSDNLYAAQKAATDLAQTLITKGAGAGTALIEQQAEQASASSGEIGQGLTALFAQQAVGTTNILSRFQGAVQNPNMELLFTGPTLRPFNFTFKLSARGVDDREQIRQIKRS